MNLLKTPVIGGRTESGSRSTTKLMSHKKHNANKDRQAAYRERKRLGMTVEQYDLFKTGLRFRPPMMPPAVT